MAAAAIINREAARLSLLLLPEEPISTRGACVQRIKNTGRARGSRQLGTLANRFSKIIKGPASLAPLSLSLSLFPRLKFQTRDGCKGGINSGYRAIATSFSRSRSNAASFLFFSLSDTFAALGNARRFASTITDKLRRGRRAAVYLSRNDVTGNK
jgi:hypothetical protein